MAFLRDDEGEKVFAATMSFIDEFSFDEPVVELKVAESKTSTVATMQGMTPADNDNGVVEIQRGDGDLETKSAVSAVTCKVPSILSLDTTETARREKLIARNARKKLLRKAGIYGDSNRVRNERKLEIAYLRERIEKLQIDLHTLQTHRGEQQTTASIHSKQPTREQESNANAMVVATCNPQISSIFQELADRQQRRRKEAERENIRLKLVMERQRKVASTLSSLLQKRVSQLAIDCSCFSSPDCPKQQIVHVLDYHGDVSSFLGLLRASPPVAYDTLMLLTEISTPCSQPTVCLTWLSPQVTCTFVKMLVASTSSCFPTKYCRSKCTTQRKLYGVISKGRTSTRATEVSTRKRKRLVLVSNGLDVVVLTTMRSLNAAGAGRALNTVIEEFTKEVYSNNSRADVKMKQVVRRFVALNEIVGLRKHFHEL